MSYPVNEWWKTYKPRYSIDQIIENPSLDPDAYAKHLVECKRMKAAGEKEGKYKAELFKKAKAGDQNSVDILRKTYGYCQGFHY